MTDLENSLRRVLHARADEVDADPHELLGLVPSSPTPLATHRRRYVGPAVALLAAAGVVGAVVVGDLRPGSAPHTAPTGDISAAVSPGMASPAAPLDPAGGTAATSPGGPVGAAPGIRIGPPGDSPTIGPNVLPTYPSTPRPTGPVGEDGIPALVGTWRLTAADGTPITQKATLTFAETGWWSAAAGCATVGGFYTWDADSGALSAGKGMSPGRERSVGAERDCYAPAVLAAVRPDAVVSLPDRDRLVVSSPQGRIYAELTRDRQGDLVRIPNPARVPGSYRIQLPASSTGSPRESAPGLLRLEVALKAGPGPGLRGSELSISSPQAGPSECVRFSLVRTLDETGRVTGTPSAGMPNGFQQCPGTSAYLLRTITDGVRAIGQTAGGALVLQGDAGTEIARLIPAD